MRINFIFKGVETSINLDQINVFYGYSGSGKTSIAETINEGFNLKNRYFNIDGYTLFKNNYDLLYIDANQTILDHTKMTAKSLIKRILLKKLYKDLLDANNQAEELINDELKKINTIVESICNDFNINNHASQMNISFSDVHLEDILEEQINISFSDKFDKNLSSSSAKELLYSLIYEWARFDKTKKIIIIDDFDNNFDENHLIHFLNSIKSVENVTFLLFTNKANSLPYTLLTNKVFAVRDKSILDLSNITYIIKNSLIPFDENGSFEDYMSGNGYLENSSYFINIMSNTRLSSIFNLGRMITNKMYIIDTKFHSDIPTINYYSKEEEKILIHFDNLLNGD